MNSNDDQNDYHLMMNVDAIMNKTLTLLLTGSSIFYSMIISSKFMNKVQPYFSTICWYLMFIPDVHRDISFVDARESISIEM